MAATREEVVLRRLLLLEQERHAIDELRDAFVEQGYECEVALEFPTVRRILENRMMDVAVINAKLTDLSDEELVGELKSLNPNMSLVIYNGTATKPRQRALRRAGADSYLSKATDPRNIVRAVRRLTGRG